LNPDALVAAKEAQAQLGVSLSLICMWVSQGKLQVRGHRGRVKLYRWGDLLQVERDTRRNDPAGQRRTTRAA
jgi:hypothetical protein